MLAYVIYPQNTKIRSSVCERCTLWFESVRFIETTTCQRLVSVGNLKLNRLSPQIKIYCLITNETPALLVQRAPNASCSDVITVPLFFSPPPPTAIIPDAGPLGTFENQDGRH